MNNNQNKVEEWLKVIEKMGVSFTNGNFSEAKAYKAQADMIFEQAEKEDKFFSVPVTNFGLLMPTIEATISEMFLNNNKKPSAEYVSMIKEDKNLKAQHIFYESMQNYSHNVDANEYVKEALNSVKEMIDEKTAQQSNMKLFNFMKKYNIVKDFSMVSEDRQNFCNACQFVLETKKNALNLNTIYENINTIADYIKLNVVSESKNDNAQEKIIEAVTDFNEKYGSLLNEEEKDVIAVLFEQEATEKKKKLLEAMKNKCLSKLSELAVDASQSEKENIKQLTEKVEAMMFEEETIVKTIASLLEINDILSEH